MFTALWYDREIDPGQIVYALTNYTDRALYEEQDFWDVILEMYRRHPEDHRNTSYFLAHAADRLCCLIDRDDIAPVQRILQSGQFDKPLRRCIDRCIAHAIERNAYELQVMLTNYKHEKIGFTNAAEQFQL